MKCGLLGGGGGAPFLKPYERTTELPHPVQDLLVFLVHGVESLYYLLLHSVPAAQPRDIQTYSSKCLSIDVHQKFYMMLY